MCSIKYCFRNNVLYEIMWEIIAERGSTQLTIWRMRTACWLPNDTNTYLEYVILIAFPGHTSVSMLTLHVLFVSERKIVRTKSFVC